jgi:hypothetical protein
LTPRAGRVMRVPAPDGETEAAVSDVPFERSKKWVSDL